MPSLTVWLYPTPFGAETGELQLKSLVERGALQVHDAASVVWMQRAPEPRVRNLLHPRAKAAGRGGAWGALVGLLVLNPVAGAAVGTAVGAAAEHLRHAGIPEHFLAEVRERLVPGTSALFVLSSGADVDQVRPVIARSEAVLLLAELSEEGQANLAALGLKPEQP